MRRQIDSNAFIQHSIIGPTGPSTILQDWLSATSSDAAWPSANLAIFCPLTLFSETLITNFGVVNGGTVSGNIDVGIYSKDGVRLCSSGSTAQGSTFSWQVLNTADVQLGTGLFYIAMAVDNTTSVFSRFTMASASFFKVMGFAEMASAFPLPATATFASVSNAYWPGVSLGVGGGLI